MFKKKKKKNTHKQLKVIIIINQLHTQGGWNPLIEACAYGFAATVRVLLEHGANVDHCDKVSDVHT